MENVCGNWRKSRNILIRMNGRFEEIEEKQKLLYVLKILIYLLAIGTVTGFTFLKLF